MMNLQSGIRAKKLVAWVALMFLSLPAVFAQNEVKMADSFRAEGKIYVVVAVMCIIFLGVGIYLFILDRKVKKLEKLIKE